MDNAALIQLIRYVLAGAFASLIHVIIFHLIGWKILPSLQADDYAVRFLKLSTRAINDATRARNSMIGNYSAFVIANMVAYTTNILWVFHGGKYDFLTEIVLFFSFSAISVLLGTMLMGILIRRFGLLTTYAFSANLFTAVMINYVVRKFFIFQG